MLNNSDTMSWQPDTGVLETLKPILEYVGMFAAATFGVIGTLFESHKEEIRTVGNTQHKYRLLNTWGKAAVVGIVLAFLVSASSKVIESRLDKISGDKNQKFQDSVIMKLQASLQTAKQIATKAKELSDSSSAIVSKLSIIEKKEGENTLKSNEILKGTLAGLYPLFPLEVEYSYNIKLSQLESDSIELLAKFLHRIDQDSVILFDFNDMGNLTLYDYPSQPNETKIGEYVREYFRERFYFSFLTHVIENSKFGNRRSDFGLFGYQQIKTISFTHFADIKELNVTATFEGRTFISTSRKVNSLYEVSSGMMQLNPVGETYNRISTIKMTLKSGVNRDYYKFVFKKKDDYFIAPIAEALKLREPQISSVK